MSRLHRFREFVARMDPTAEPQRALAAGLYVDPPDGSLAASVATRLELEPASTHLLVGYIGSGKTTTALKIKERLLGSAAETGDRVAYFDVSRRHRMDDENLLGVLVAIAGMDLVECVKQRGTLRGELQEAATEVSRFARGYSEWVHETYDYGYDEEPDDFNELPEQLVVHPGVLKPIHETLSPKLVDVVTAIRRLSAALSAHAIYAFDSLDRLRSPTRFADAVREDIRALSSVEIGSVVVGPIRFALGHDTSVRDLFDHVHVVRPPNPDEPPGLQFCCEVLRRRAAEDMLPDELLPVIARASGGILRDLVGLARRAGEEAYARGADRIELAHVQVAVQALGEAIAFGLDAAELKLLRHLHSGAGFVIRGERELSLIEQRRVLPAGLGAWRVHPALEPLLAAIPDEAA